MQDHVDIMQFFMLQNECDLSITDKNGRLPLHCACQKGTSIVTGIIEKDSSICDTRDKEGTTPLQLMDTYLLLKH